MNKHKSNKIKENSNTVRHLNNGTDHRHSKSCCDQSSPTRRTIRHSWYQLLTCRSLVTFLVPPVFCGMLMSWNGNIFRVTGHLCGEFTGPRWIPRTHKGQWRGALMFSLICAWINRWVNNGEAGDLRRYRAHYDVIVVNCEDPRLLWNLEGLCTI